MMNLRGNSSRSYALGGRGGRGGRGGYGGRGDCEELGNRFEKTSRGVRGFVRPYARGGCAGRDDFEETGNN